MQRPNSKNTRQPNALEKRFHAFTKESDCIVCGNPGPSILDHCYGSTCKENKILIGHWWVIPLCAKCDSIKTAGSAKGFIIFTGRQLKDWWADHQQKFMKATTFAAELIIPTDVYYAVMNCREYQP